MSTRDSGLIVVSDGYGADIDVMLPTYAEMLLARRQQGGASVDVDVEGILSHIETLRAFCGDTRFLKAAKALPEHLQKQVFPFGVPDAEDKPDFPMGFLP